MRLERLIEALHGAADDLHVEDILDALWLATRDRTLSLHAAAGVPAPPDAEPLPGPDAGSRDVPSDDLSGETESAVEEEAPRAEAQARAPVYATGDVDSGATVKASPVALPAGYALTGRLSLSRALQPFRQRWPSSHAVELDEERTVEATAEQRGRLQLVFRPRQERWYEAHVVLEDDWAMGIWRDTLRDFAQLLRDTGAFRDVRTWRLRMPADAAQGQAEPGGYLESATGLRAPASMLGGRGVRRLIFFATHGSSERWLDGSYARLLSSWGQASSVVLLHMLESEQWQLGTLGEPQGLCHVRNPGDLTSALRVERFWWMLDDQERTVVSVPATPLTPDGLGNWAQMQMARGRRCPVIELDLNPPPFVESDHTFEREIEMSAGLLKESFPEAFRLAVYLSPGAFTIPVARLVQEAKLGSAAHPRHISEVLLSGLVFAHSSRDANVDPNEVYYELYREARAILMRSLRDADVEIIAAALEQRVSAYLESIYGRAITFRALVADENGDFDIPQWAQPFARLGLSLLGTSVPGVSAAQLVEAFQSVYSPEIVARVARLVADTDLGQTLDPRSIDDSVWGAMTRSKLVRRNTDGQWTFRPGLEPLLTRMSPAGLDDVHVLWLDDHHEGHQTETERLRSLGARIDLVEDSAAALRSLQHNRYDVVVTDMARGGDHEAGFERLREIRAMAVRVPVVVYAGGFAADPQRRERALQAGAFACTNDASELIEHIVQAAHHHARSAAATPRERRVLEALRSMGLLSRVGTTSYLENPRQLAEDILQGQTDPQSRFRTHLRIIQAFADSLVNQIIEIQGETLRVVAKLVDPDKTGSHYTTADWNGLIGRAATSGELVWVPDVARTEGYLRAEPSTRSELVIPVIASDRAHVLGVVNIELEETDALGSDDVRWLAQYCEPLNAWIAGADATASRETGEDDYGLVVGIDVYASPALPDLSDAASNARLVEQWLVSSDGGRVPRGNLRALYSESASLQGIRGAFRDLATTVPSGRRLYLYFAGHYVHEPKRGLEVPYLVPTDYSGSHELFDIRKGLDELLARTEFEESVLLVDGHATSLSDAQVLQLVELESGVDGLNRLGSIFMAMPQAQSEPEWESRAGLTQLLISGLQGSAADASGVITSNSLGEFLRRSSPVTLHVPSRSILFGRAPETTHVVVLANISAPAGMVRIVDTSGAVVGEGRLSEGSCRFSLRPGLYRVEHPDSGTERAFAVPAGERSIDVWLGPSPSGGPDFTAPSNQRTTVQSSRTRSRIILAFEGTLNAPGESDEAVAETNVKKFHDLIIETGSDGVRQVRWYAPGYGSSGWSRVLGGAMGIGLSRSVKDAYRWLVEVYNPGDRIFMVGFSRGAYVAQSLAAFIWAAGLLRPEDASRVDDTYERYRKLRYGEGAFRDEQTEPVTIAFLGLWDCVGDPGLFAGDDAEQPLPPIVENAHHAVAIDERRDVMRPKLWSVPLPRPEQRIEQRWFAGVHGDIGGVYAEHDLADIPLRWMLDRAAECGIEFDTEQVNSTVRPNPLGVLHRVPRLLPLTSYREIGKTPHGHETVDPSALERLERVPEYKPPNLVDYRSRQS